MLPPAKPFRVSHKSSDDLGVVAELDAAEERLRAAKILIEEEAQRADKEERHRIELQKELATLQATQSVETKLSKSKPEDIQDRSISLSPQAVTLRGKHWKVTVPLALLISSAPIIWSLVSDYMQMKRDFKTQTETYGAQAKRIEEINIFAHEVSRSNDDLREKVAQLSGYLAAILPKAGVKVPGAEPGATFVNLISDPLPIGEASKRQKPIVVHTPVPAPAPR
jgi:hypothetical protein